MFVQECNRLERDVEEDWGKGGMQPPYTANTMPRNGSIFVTSYVHTFHVARIHIARVYTAFHVCMIHLRSKRRLRSVQW